MTPRASSRFSVRAFSRLPLEERVALVIALAFAALATIGQGLQFFSDDYTAFSTGMLLVVIFSALAGVALTFEADVLPSTLDAQKNHVAGLALKSSLEQTLLVCGVELVLGEILFLIGLAVHAPGINDDITVILGPVLVGVLFGGVCCLLGILVGILVAWPLVKLVQFFLQRRAGKPSNPISAGIALLFFTVVPFAILGVLGSNATDAVGTTTGRGLYGIINLYTSYTGTPDQQVMAWIARVLGLAIVGEIILLRRIGHVHGIGENMTIDPPAKGDAPTVR